MTTIKHTAGGFRAPSADRGQSGSTLARLLGLIEKQSAKRRQRNALERLDNRLRRDIGLPPRNADAAGLSIRMFDSYR